MPGIALNKLCEVEDFSHPVLLDAIRAMGPDHISAYSNYPHGKEHRESWEKAQLVAGAAQLGALGADSMVLAVGAGSERPVFALTNSCRLVFATDIYGTGDFASRDAQETMLVNPDAFAPFPYNRKRLVVQHMNALDLRYEDSTFDLVFSLSSLQHFGGVDGARKGLAEMARVCRPGGIVMLTTECIVNGKPDFEINSLQLFSPATVESLIAGAALEAVEPVRYDLSAATRRYVQNMEQVVNDLVQHNRTNFPHIVMEIGGCEFTSLSLFMRKASS